MNAGDVTRCFVDSNIWLYRFILNSSDRSAIQKQQIATNVTSQENLLVSTQVIKGASQMCKNRFCHCERNEMERSRSVS